LSHLEYDWESTIWGHLLGEPAEVGGISMMSALMKLVIADWWLSDGTGLMIIDEAVNRGAKTFLLSGYVTETLGDNARRHSLLRKPIAPKKLVAAVQQAIGDPTNKADKWLCGET
jgi:hypothetical protein